MAFFYSKRKLRTRGRVEGQELNIVPYLDILMNLIMFMLLSITGLSAFGILNVNVKKEFPSESKVIVGAEGDIPYEVLVQTMDAIRETPGKERKLLFTDVTLGAM